MSLLQVSFSHGLRIVHLELPNPHGRARQGAPGCYAASSPRVEAGRYRVATGWQWKALEESLQQWLAVGERIVEAFGLLIYRRARPTIRRGALRLLLIGIGQNCLKTSPIAHDQGKMAS